MAVKVSQYRKKKEKVPKKVGEKDEGIMIITKYF